jgi:hypothetical protein
LYQTELASAKKFVQGLAGPTSGQKSRFYDFTSGKASSGRVPKDESEDWFYAMHGYRAWGKGFVTITCSKGADGNFYNEYSMYFKYKVYDRYNWDKFKGVTIMGMPVEDNELGELHKAGLAQEYDLKGSRLEHVTWKVKK